jgi:hypothetical protein
MKKIIFLIVISLFSINFSEAQSGGTPTTSGSGATTGNGGTKPAPSTSSSTSAKKTPANSDSVQIAALIKKIDSINKSHIAPVLSDSVIRDTNFIVTLGDTGLTM